MVKKLITLLAVALFAVGVKAQMPAQTRVIGGQGNLGLRALSSCGSDAGTISLEDGLGNPITDSIVYLSFGDSIRIIPGGDAILNGDPDTTTTPGLTYAFYNCPPTVDSIFLIDIVADPCIILNDTLPFVVNVGDIQGNATFINDGGLQALNMGEPAQFWFAPITIDDFNNSVWENGDSSCVSVSTAQAFGVVYLNAIDTSNVNTNLDGAGCTGTFELNGGLPEVIDTMRYSINIVNNADPSIEGIVSSQNRTTDSTTSMLINYFVPVAGTYTITVTDTLGASTSFELDMAGCTSVEFTLPRETRDPMEAFCIPLTVSNFNNVNSIEFNLNWDATVLRLDNIQDFNPNLSDLSLGGNFNIGNALNGEVFFSWLPFDNSSPTLADGDTLFNICFTVLGTLGSSTPISFSPGIEPSRVVGEVGVNPVDTRYGYIFNDGQINVSTSALLLDIETGGLACHPNNGGTNDDGFVSVGVSGGVAPYNVIFTPSIGAPTNAVINTAGDTVLFSNLPADTYTITITDSAPGTPNTDSRTVDLLSATEIVVNTSPFQLISCPGDANGILIAEVFLGNVRQDDPLNNGYSFSWSNSAGNIDTLSNLIAGNYSVTVTNQFGCMADANSSLADPPRIIIPANGVNITNASCSGVADGSIELTADMGSPFSGGEYIYAWEDFGTDTAISTNIPNAAPGLYRLTITDSNGCSLIDSVSVAAAKNLTIDGVPTPITCNGAGDGSIVVTAGTLPVFSESLPYSFAWSGTGTENPVDNGNVSTVSNLEAGDYTVTLTDDVGCEISGTFTITEPEVLQLAIDTLQDESCTIGNDGFASVSVSGGTAPYNYQWDDPNAQTDTVATGLSIGNYRVIVTDDRNCIDSLTAFIDSPTRPQIVSFPNDSVSCNGDVNGALAVSAVNGGGNIIDYTWNTGTTGPNATSIINLSPGVYTVTITADDGCITVDSALVVDPAPLQLDSLVAVSPLCPGFSDGTLTVFASGATAPYTYIWDTPSGPDTSLFVLRPGLAAGAYEVTIVDANNCPPVIGTGQVEDPESIVVEFSNVVGVDCAEGDCDGEALATVRLSEFTPQLFDINWGNGTSAIDTSSLLATGLCAGINTVAVFDEKGCNHIDTIIIPSPDTIELNLAGTDPSCNGFSNGTLSVSPVGGTPGYTINWPGLGSSQAALTDVAAGTYTVILTDANGCEKTDSLSLVEPFELQLTIDPDATMDPSCAGTTDGVLAVLVNTQDPINPLGTDPYTWSDAIASSSETQAINLAAGNYSVTVTDTEGCTDTLSFTLNEPSPIQFSFPDPAPPACFGDATLFTIDTIAGGAGNSLLDYTYSIDNNGISFTPDQAASILAGTRIVTVQDIINGCTASDTLMIEQPEELTVTFSPSTVVVELGDTLTTLNPIINSTQIDSFLWSPSDFLSSFNVQNPTVNPLESQDYNLRVVDINGCTASGDVFVELNRTRNVYIPNAISPNGDGRNDEFRIFACKAVRSVNYARIFDRWGSLLYSQNNIGVPDCAGGTILWDGTINNEDLPMGVYVYVIEVEFIDNVTLVYRGDVAIMR